MKYIWIVMLACIDIIWIITSVYEYIRTIKVMCKIKRRTVFEWLDDFLFEAEDYSTACIFTHLFILFMFSFVVWLQ